MSANPIGLIIAGITALLVGILLLIKNREAVIPLKGQNRVRGNTFIFNVTGANARDIWEELQPQIEQSFVLAGVM